MNLFRPTLLAVMALAAAALSSCDTGSLSGSSLAAYNAYDRPAKLPKNPSKVRVKVSIQNQMAYVMEGNEALLVMPVGVGKSGSPTPVGNFRIFNKKHQQRANTHGFAHKGDDIRQTYLAKKPAGYAFKGTPMPYWCEFKPAYGFHSGWMKPYPCTHGCLRMHHNVSPKFFKLVSNGTPVSIARTQPEDSTLGKDIPRPPDSTPLPDYHPSFYLGDGAFKQHKAPSFE
ncbi:MAG: murein L,D-transpeptidase [Verrucomicrobia bacterium]|nr:MAG: murein L,D-transpeptidase [Verrucomicrobiota bacterium]TAE87077.1 MAG: murein L,D-transpeptidase [Verrucomicrobiota bacterium]TAF24867.1 MAG: murein L,D-transpeptidase [Verrucomicrobiota bacterium]TAF40626.1 MAG: murein L,D-transpeptidase [Verrucomicrobiota bacterium]